MNIRQRTPPTLSEAINWLVGYVRPELVTLVCMHEHDCYVRQAIQVVLGECGLSEAGLIEEWFNQAASDE